jgi:hypothetical protein
LMMESAVKASDLTLFVLFGSGLPHKKLCQLLEHASFELGVSVIVIMFYAFMIV